MHIRIPKIAKWYLNKNQEKNIQIQKKIYKATSNLFEKKNWEETICKYNIKNIRKLKNVKKSYLIKQKPNNDIRGSG